MKCNAHPEILFDYAGFGQLGFPCRLDTGDDYEQDCNRCEIVISLSREQHATVCGHNFLQYDKRSGGVGGLGVGAVAAVGAVVAAVGA